MDTPSTADSAPLTAPAPAARATPVPATPAAIATPSRRVVVGARMSLLMLLIAGVALVVLGIVTLGRSDPGQLDGWLREVFGTVFGAMAIVVGLAIGIPGAIGMAAMAGARREGSTPALPIGARRFAAGLGIASVLGIAGVLLVRGNGLSIPDLGLAGLITLLAGGLAGAVMVSPHRIRALVTTIALALVLLWVARLLASALGLATA
jgi:hypothetical protein